MESEEGGRSRLALSAARSVAAASNVTHDDAVAGMVADRLGVADAIVPTHVMVVLVDDDAIRMVRASARNMKLDRIGRRGSGHKTCGADEHSRRNASFDGFHFVNSQLEQSSRRRLLFVSRCGEITNT